MTERIPATPNHPRVLLQGVRHRATLRRQTFALCVIVTMCGAVGAASAADSKTIVSAEGTAVV